MEDTLLIIMLAAIAVLGFAAILIFSGFLSKNRRNKAEKTEDGEKGLPPEKAYLLDEYDRTGVMRFDKIEKTGDRVPDAGEGME